MSLTCSVERVKKKTLLASCLHPTWGFDLFKGFYKQITPHCRYNKQSQACNDCRGGQNMGGGLRLLRALVLLRVHVQRQIQTHVHLQPKYNAAVTCRCYLRRHSGVSHRVKGLFHAVHRNIKLLFISFKCSFSPHRGFPVLI